MNESKHTNFPNAQDCGIAELCAKTGNYLFFNDKECSLKGVAPHKLENVSIFELYAEEDRDRLKAVFEQCLASPDRQTYLFDYQYNNHFFQMNLVKNQRGNIFSSLCDVSHMRHLEQQQIIHQENIKCLSDAVSGANIGCWDFYPQENRIIANKAWVTQKKYRDEDFRENSDLFSDVIDGLTKWASIVHPDDLDATNKLIEQHLNAETDVYDAKFRVKCGDNEWRWIHDMGRVFQRDEHGNAIRMNGVHIDITERKQSELREKSRSNVLELITRGESLSVILAAIVGVVELDNPAMLCSILLLDEQGKHLVNGTAPSLPDFYNKAINGVAIGVGMGSCGTAAFTNERVIVDDIQTHPFWVDFKDLAQKAELAACWSEPIRAVNGSVLGTFAIYHHRTNRPSASDLALIEQTASLASIAIEKKQAEEKLKRAASVFIHAHEGIIIGDAFGNIIEVNDAFSRITGYTPEEVLGNSTKILHSSKQSEESYKELWKAIVATGHWHGEVWSRRKNGEDYPVMLTTSAVNDGAGNVHHYVTLCTDITLMKEHHKQLELMAHYDALTNLPNRVLLADRLSQSMIQCKRRAHSLAVAFMDLDGFKAVNDRYGHTVGDKLLIKVANRMKKALREGDTLARIGGDEFIAVMVDLENIAACEPVLERLLKAAAEPVIVDNIAMQVSVSIGVTDYPRDHADADLLMRHADQAMYIAKQSGKNRFHFFDTEQDIAIKTQGQSIGDIHTALNNEEFVLYYQPKVNMRTGKVIGTEALIRWQHPSRGLIPPLSFLPVIEGHLISLAVGEWVINNALMQISKWQESGVKIAVSVNISAFQLQQDDFPSRLASLLNNHPKVSSKYLQLEILETSALHDINKVCETINACHELGVQFALDDFGTGYSSLTHLKRLPACLIKIDQSFVRDMLEDADDLAIVEGVVGLAKAFRRDVIAEGVETEAHGLALLQLGCDLAQGYGIARPMPSENIPKWIEEWKVNDSWLA